MLSFHEKNKFYDDLKSAFNKITKLMVPGIKNDVVMSMMHHTILSVAKIKNFVPIWLFKIFHFELFKFIVPVRVNSCGVIMDGKSADVADDDDGKDDTVPWAVPWIFPTVQLERMRWIDVNMAGSVVYQEKKKSDKIWKQQPPRKKRRTDTEREEVLSATLEDHENQAIAQRPGIRSGLTTSLPALCRPSRNSLVTSPHASCRVPRTSSRLQATWST